MIEEYNKILLPIIYRRKYYYQLRRKGIIHYTIKQLAFDLFLTIAVLKETTRLQLYNITRYNSYKITKQVNKLEELGLIKKKSISIA